jgi:hypothetical protein
MGAGMKYAFEDLEFALYQCYEDIPLEVKEYVLTVAGFKGQAIEILPLWEINDYFVGLYEYEKQKLREEYQDGWVL